MTVEGVKVIDPETVDITNLDAVAANGEYVVILGNLANQYMTKERALVLAAWLVVVADDGERPAFGRLLRRVLDT